VFAEPHRWATEYFDHDAERYALEVLSKADTMILPSRLTLSLNGPQRVFVRGRKNPGTHTRSVNEDRNAAFLLSRSRVKPGDNIAATVEIRGDVRPPSDCFAANHQTNTKGRFWAESSRIQVYRWNDIEVD
jgi:hypothetical protein